MSQSAVADISLAANGPVSVLLVLIYTTPFSGHRPGR